MTESRDFPPFSVVLPVYAGDDPGYLNEAIESTLSQTVMPSELVIVEDGDLTEQLYGVLNRWKQQYSSVVRRTYNESNRGLSRSLIKGVNKASHEYVARMDADDICLEDRFEKQLQYLTENDTVDVLGGYIREFSTDESTAETIREVPTTHAEIQQMAKFRNPMNHVTVLFRRESVIRAGNYRPVDRMEDYDLWVRMLLNGATFANIPDVLVRVRGGPEMYSRRGGLEYAREEIRMQREFRSWDFTNQVQFYRNLLLRTGLRFVPNTIRGNIYKLFARE